MGGAADQPMMNNGNADNVSTIGQFSLCITLKVRPRAKIEAVKSAMTTAEHQIQSNSKGSRRTKERKIGEVIQKVQKWRHLYYQNCESLEEAAKKVGISKKSLDDYFLQLKNGKLNGFNFNEHKNDKIGILRNWNKHHKDSQPMAMQDDGNNGPKVKVSRSSKTIVK